MNSYTYTNGNNNLLISYPHIGTYLPESFKKRMAQEFFSTLPDTDWYVDKVYSFAEEIGCSELKAVYNRYYVDLNRDPNQHNLYHDGRFETEIVPIFAFNKQKLYLEEHQPTNSEIKDRISTVHSPYHHKIRDQLHNMKAKYQNIFLLDAHSIKRIVPSIQTNPFPDVILGTADGTSCSKEVELFLWKHFQRSGFNVSLNKPFKGGFITRNFGDPQNGIHAFQIEMSQDLYLNESTKTFDSQKSVQLRDFLKQTLLLLLDKFNA